METESCTPKQSTCCCKHGKCAAAILALFLLAGVVCWHVHHAKHWHHPDPMGLKPGTLCTVQLRHDVFGKAGESPDYAGKLVSVSPNAILLERDGFEGRAKERYWIPKSNILIIQYEAKDAPPMVPSM